GGGARGCRPRLVGAARRRAQPCRRGGSRRRIRRRAPLTDWKGFAAGAPELAAFAEERLRDTGILILATNRADGWPRISPTEPYHAFAVDIERAGFISFGKDKRLMRWSARSGLEVLRHPDAGKDSD